VLILVGLHCGWGKKEGDRGWRKRKGEEGKKKINQKKN